jgi:hypothetical protein
VTGAGILKIHERYLYLNFSIKKSKMRRAAAKLISLILTLFPSMISTHLKSRAAAW